MLREKVGAEKLCRGCDRQLPPQEFAKNQNRCRRCKAEWTSANRDKAAEYHRRWAAANPEKVKEANRRWREANPEKYLAVARNSAHRRLTLRSNTDLSSDDIAGIIAGRTMCPLCRKKMTDGRGPRQKHLDHIIPLNIGGTHTYANVRVICRTCNLSRPKDGSDTEGFQPALWAIRPHRLGESPGAGAGEKRGEGSRT